jgi:hypothetical protein
VTLVTEGRSVSKACDAGLCPAHAQGGGQASHGERLLARQGAHARRRPALIGGRRRFNTLVEKVLAEPSPQRTLDDLLRKGPPGYWKS